MLPRDRGCMPGTGAAACPGPGAAAGRDGRARPRMRRPGCGAQRPGATAGCGGRVRRAAAGRDGWARLLTRNALSLSSSDGRAGRAAASLPGNGERRGRSGLHRAGWSVTPTRG